MTASSFDQHSLLIITGNVTDGPLEMDASSSKAADVVYPREHGGPSLAAMTLFVSLFLSALITAFYGLVDSSTYPQEYNDGIHLAVSPKCGELSGNVTDANAGLDLRNYQTIVSFGVRPAFSILLQSMADYIHRIPIRMVGNKMAHP